jgi:hypothetical protein
MKRARYEIVFIDVLGHSVLENLDELTVGATG